MAEYIPVFVAVGVVIVEHIRIARELARMHREFHAENQRFLQRYEELSKGFRS